MKPNLLPFIGEKWAGVPQPTTDFAGKTVLVTGANVGLGFEAAAKFTALNADKVILAVRNISKGAAAQRQIEQRTHLVVTSEAHRWLEEKDLPDPGPYGGSILKAVNAKPADGKSWDGMLQNGRSKLFAMYVIQGLAELANAPAGESQVIATSVCPGACKSELVRDFKSAGLGYLIALKIFDVLFNKTAEEGARVYVSAAALGSEAHGCWYKTTAITKPGDFVTSSKGQELQQKVWGEVVDVLKMRVPEVEALASR
ncbi:hypothetical protein OEA41_009406 [Lepraria neglecta]|uniref:NAD(P)-binding protein n=1 Tax=Lepraria neglecta TaxID=209136 RepID=A0AAE0DHL7_9LECA|nr:hypothetical protein OEA41_009406 [Lepraria neglecta]